MNAEIITIGDEILIGQIVNTNSVWLAQQLTNYGIGVSKMYSISDNRDDILDTLNNANSNLVILTGGLGPTKDDITKETLSEFFESSLVQNEEVLEHVVSIFESRGMPVLDVNRKQAEVIEGCRLLPNKNGTAPGMWMEKEGQVFVSLPGVPYEMKAIMQDYVFPILQKEYALPSLYHRTILTTGMGESQLAEIIKKWEFELTRKGMSLAYLPSPGQVRLRITAKKGLKKEQAKLVDEAVEELYVLIGNLIFGEETQTLESVIGDLLRINGKTITTAESCTGGYIAHLITSVSGSSNYFKGGVVCYSNDIKVKDLGVEREKIKQYGAVSEEVVKQMALGALNRYETDFAIATSGIAGPTGGSEDKPVGSVWIALASKDGVSAFNFNFGNNRERNIRRSALAALNLLRKEII